MQLLQALKHDSTQICQIEEGKKQQHTAKMHSHFNSYFFWNILFQSTNQHIQELNVHFHLAHKAISCLVNRLQVLLVFFLLLLPLAWLNFSHIANSNPKNHNYPKYAQNIQYRWRKCEYRRHILTFALTHAHLTERSMCFIWSIVSLFCACR